ncbi:exonuclease subunit SbcC [Aquifex pyrophilus]
MRPLKLELKGFTVYRKPQVIDFSNLSFFVIQGKTGAGKTSIIDAITYALYGKVPRYGSSVATKHVLSRGEKELKVSLDFSIRGKKYRVERFYRAFPEDSQVRVYEEGRRLNLKGRDATEKWLTQIAGLDYKTFTKVILLPQGAFDTFLKDASERKKILVNLLGLEELEKIAQLAGEEYRKLEGIRETLKRELITLKDYDEKKEEKLKEELKRSREKLTKLKEEEERVREEYQRAREKYEIERELSEVEERLRAYEEREKEIEKLKEKLNLSRRVAPYVPVAKRIDEIDLKLSELRLKKEKLIKEIKGLTDDLNLLKKKEAELEARKERVKEYIEKEKELEIKLSKLEEVKNIKKEVEKLKSELKNIHENLKKAELKYEDLKERVNKGKKLIEETEKRLRGIKKKFSEEKYTELKSKERLVEELRKKERELKTKRDEKEKIEERYKDAISELNRIRDELTKKERELKEKELLYHAHMVASYLSRGDRCPVCGGIYRGSHIPSGDFYEISELSAHVENLQKKERELDKLTALLKEKLGNFTQDIRKLEVEIKELKRELPENLKEEIRKLEALKSKKEELEEKLEKYRKALEIRVNEKEEAYRNLVNLQEKLNYVNTAIKEKSERLKDYLSLLECGDINECERIIKEEIEAIRKYVRDTEEKEKILRKKLEEVSIKKSKLEGELGELKESIETLEREKKEKLEKLAEIYDIAKSPSEVLGVYLGEKEKEVEETIREYEENLRELSFKRKELREKLKEYEDTRDLRKTEDIYLKVKEEIERLTKAIGELETELQHVRERIKRKEEITEELKALEEKLRVYGVIKNDFRADRFQKYVADIMLSKVIDRASEYFYKLTGNYFFELDERKNITVRDTTTNQLRPVNSLSGGETFLASLSLAFGVSDILSGNAHLESLFIDEGFGSLDEDTRERVGEILEAIKTNVNRMIGIISHIPDLAEKFSQKIIVEKKGDFSEIKVIY